MSRHPSRWGLLLASLLVAIMLMLVPLPAPLAALWPYWLALVLGYWVLEAPERVGLGVAFAAGLLADLVHGSLLGEQALRMVILAFLLDRFRTRMRFFPIWQQGLAMGAILCNDRIVAALVHLMTHTPQWPLAYWLSPLAGALMWGPVFAVLDTLRHRRKRG